MTDFVNVFPEIIVLERRVHFSHEGWAEMFTWCAERVIDLVFKNMWDTDGMHHYSFDIGLNKQKRMWFTLRYT